MSYEQAEQDVAYLTGIRVPAKTQQRLVHAQTFALPTEQEAIAELGVDGGQRGVRTPLGEECQWRDYKTIATDRGLVANFQNNAQLPIVGEYSTVGKSPDLSRGWAFRGCGTLWLRLRQQSNDRKF